MVQSDFPRQRAFHCIPPRGAPWAPLPVSVALSWGSLYGFENPGSLEEQVLQLQSSSISQPHPLHEGALPFHISISFTSLCMASSVLLSYNISDQLCFHLFFKLIAL